MNELLDEVIRSRRPLIVDGALATELETRGADLSGGLWSGRTLIENPEMIQTLHEDYVRAGARVLTTASYQISFQELTRRGVPARRVAHYLLNSVALARAAILSADQPTLVAGSIGTFGAHLADGSEYTGQFQASMDELVDFHRAKTAILCQSAADLVSFETIPQVREVRAILRLLQEFPFARVAINLACKDAEHLNSGESIDEVIDEMNFCPQVAVIGINCTPPRFILPLIQRLRRRSEKVLMVAPNSGETYDPIRGFTGAGDDFPLLEAAKSWRAAGAEWIGGCCRIGVEKIAALARELGRG